jgi:hypothetical protein
MRAARHHPDDRNRLRDGRRTCADVEAKGLSWAAETLTALTTSRAIGVT